MTALVTGGAGFLGTRLIESLLAGHGHPPVSRVICADQVASPLTDPRIHSQVGSIADDQFARRIVEPDVTHIWHLAAVLSGQSEAEPHLATVVNVGGTQALLDACSARLRRPRFVFASTIAVFGGPLPAVVPEDLAVRPGSTYGTTKAIAELLVLEATRRGVVDGIACRVPTVSVRPGLPNSAMSSFVSGIVREPIGGVRSRCPVPLETRLWVASPITTTTNLAHAGFVDNAAIGAVRTLNLPGLTLTPAELLDSLERAAGRATRDLVDLDIDPAVSAMVGSWPGAFDVSRALGIGFVNDRGADALVAQFMASRAASSPIA